MSKRDVMVVMLKGEEDLALVRWMDEVVFARKQTGDRGFDRSKLALDLIRRGREEFEREQAKPPKKRPVR